MIQERPADTGKLQMIRLLEGDIEVLVGVADSQIEVRQRAQRTAPAEGATDGSIGFPRLKDVAVLPIAAKIEDVASIDDMKAEVEISLPKGVCLKAEIGARQREELLRPGIDEISELVRRQERKIGGKQRLG